MFGDSYEKRRRIHSTLTHFTMLSYCELLLLLVAFLCMGRSMLKKHVWIILISKTYGFRLVDDISAKLFDWCILGHVYIFEHLLFFVYVMSIPQTSSTKVLVCVQLSPYKSYSRTKIDTTSHVCAHVKITIAPHPLFPSLGLFASTSVVYWKKQFSLTLWHTYAKAELPWCHHRRQYSSHVKHHHHCLKYIKLN